MLPYAIQELKKAFPRTQNQKEIGKHYHLMEWSLEDDILTVYPLMLQGLVIMCSGIEFSSSFFGAASKWIVSCR